MVMMEASLQLRLWWSAAAAEVSAQQVPDSKQLAAMKAV